MKSHRKHHRGCTYQLPSCKHENTRLFRAAARLIVLLVFQGVASGGFAQVIFNGASSPVTAELPPGTDTVTVSQTIPSQTNGLLVICVSMNNQQSTTSQVTSITDNGSGVGIFPVGTVSTSPAKSRVEIWARKSPPAGLNTIRITIPVTAPTVGVVAASADFAQVDQTTPFETFGSNTGSGNGSSPTVTVTSAAGEVVIDTVATAPAVTLTHGTGQIQEWQASSGVSSTDTEGAGSIKAGSAPTATMTWTHPGAAVWAIGAVSIRSSIKTAVTLREFAAYASLSGTLLRWQAAHEIRNLGFNVYHEDHGERVKLNRSLIPGAALMTGNDQHFGKFRSYSWVASSQATGPYWLEDVDLNGTRTMNGPIYAAAADSAIPVYTQNSGESRDTIESGTVLPASSGVVERAGPVVLPSAEALERQFNLAARPAVKILVQHEGWYRVTQPELVAAGLDRDVDPVFLQLYAEGREQPIFVTGASSRPGGFGSSAAIEFYGTGIDTQYSGTRVYWLIAGREPGLRVQQLPETTGSNPPPVSFPYSVELKQRTTYFAALITADGNNFFGDMISSTPLDQILNVSHLVNTSAESAKVEIALQGVVPGVPHDVQVMLNGTALNNITFFGQTQGKLTINLPAGILQEGANTFTLTSQAGELDISLADYIRLTYPHSYTAESDSLEFTAMAGAEVKVDGFAMPPAKVLDITDPARPLELIPGVSKRGTEFALKVQVPWLGAGEHRLLAVAQDRVASPEKVVRNVPSHWHSAQPGSEIVVVTYPGFISALKPLVELRRKEGHSTSLILIDQLYDEFNFGERTPAVIRDLLKAALRHWRIKPEYLLLAGHGSVDPRNFLGLGFTDFVPTKIVPTSELMTASDDWFSDFDNLGMPTIATGRLPVRTVDDAKLVVDKIVKYEENRTSEPWMNSVLMVADRNDYENFTSDSQSVQALLPSAVTVTDVFATGVDSAIVRQQVVNGINQGQALVNYMGHGSVEVWSGNDLFDDAAASSLANGSELPVFLMMDCLNGFFHDVYTVSLAESLLTSPNGGAVAVLASSALNEAQPQTLLDQNIVRNLFQQNQSLGKAIVAAKSMTDNPEVRRTYILFGDPAMKMKTPSTNFSVR